jgi:hypothetical protein
MGLLRVKDLVWRDGRLSAVVREWEEDEEGNVVEHKEPEAILRWIPVITGYEHVLLKLINGRDPNELLFPESHPCRMGRPCTPWNVGMRRACMICSRGARLPSTTGVQP